MDLFQTQLTLPAMSQGFREITRELAAIVQEAGFEQGLCHILSITPRRHLIQENADPDVQCDLQASLLGSCRRETPTSTPLKVPMTCSPMCAVP